MLAEHGYAGTNTNLIAETAGVSVGSLYQYFPNKNALIAALHDRHDRQMLDLIDQTLAANPAATLRDRVAAIVGAMLGAHLLEPALHRVLEREFPLFDQPREHSLADQDIHRRMRHLLEFHRDEIAQPDRDLATCGAAHHGIAGARGRAGTAGRLFVGAIGTGGGGRHHGLSERASAGRPQAARAAQGGLRQAAAASVSRKRDASSGALDTSSLA